MRLTHRDNLPLNFPELDDPTVTDMWKDECVWIQPEGCTSARAWYGKQGRHVARCIRKWMPQTKPNGQSKGPRVRRRLERTVKRRPAGWSNRH